MFTNKKQMQSMQGRIVMDIQVTRAGGTKVTFTFILIVDLWPWIAPGWRTWRVSPEGPGAPIYLFL